MLSLKIRSRVFKIGEIDLIRIQLYQQYTVTVTRSHNILTYRRKLSKETWVLNDNLLHNTLLFILVLVLPTAKAIFEHYPRQLLTATLSGLPSESKQLAILYEELIQDHHTSASMVPILAKYLRLDDAPDTVQVPVAAADLATSATLSIPLKTPGRLAVVWKTIGDLASGFVECSIKFHSRLQGGSGYGS